MIPKSFCKFIGIMLYIMFNLLADIPWSANNAIWKPAVKRSWLTSSIACPSSRDRIVVSTLRCGRRNPGSNPGHGRIFLYTRNQDYFSWENAIFYVSLQIVWHVRLPRSSCMESRVRGTYWSIVKKDIYMICKT